MDNDQLYDLYLGTFSKVRAGLVVHDFQLQDAPGDKFVDYAGREAIAVALGVEGGKHARGAIYSKPTFLSRVATLAGPGA